MKSREDAVALVVQRIEQWFAEPPIQVRFLSRALIAVSDFLPYPRFNSTCIPECLLTAEMTAS